MQAPDKIAWAGKTKMHNVSEICNMASPDLQPTGRPVWQEISWFLPISTDLPPDTAVPDI